jgi:hypothetical protein
MYVGLWSVVYIICLFVIPVAELGEAYRNLNHKNDPIDRSISD